MKNQIGVCDFSFPCGGVVGVEMAGRAGFQGIQIMDAANMGEGFPLLNPVIQEMYKEAAEKYGLVFQGLNLSALCFSNLMGSPLDSSNGAVIKNYLDKSVETCVQMGIKTVMMNVNNIHFVSKPSPVIMENIKDTLRYANDRLEDIGVVLAIETCIPAPMFHDIRQEISENIKLCFDIANPVYHGIGYPPELMKAYGLDAIDHFHIKDFRKGYFGYLTQNCEMCYPGEGGAGFWECVDLIHQGGFKGWFISESIYTIPNFYDENDTVRNPLEAARKDAAIMRSAFCAEQGGMF